MKKFIFINLFLMSFAVKAYSGTTISPNRILAEETIGAGSGFIGGMVSMGLWMAVAGSGNTGDLRIGDYINSYVIGSMAAGAFGVYYTGRYGGDSGSYLNSLAGSFCGTLLGYMLGAGKDRNFAFYYAVLLPLLQSAGAVCGFNVNSIAGSLITKKKKQVAVSIPAISFTGTAGYLTMKIEICKIIF